MPTPEAAPITEALSAEDVRKRAIVHVSIVGIVANLALAGLKAAIGLLTHSIAIVLDAVNNLSDAASSIITIVGTRLAGMRPNRNHPYGYGRVEYLTTIAVSMIVLWAGLTSFFESGERILKPTTPEYTPLALGMVGVAVAAKLVLCRFVRSRGKQLDSDALVASGTDALMDAVISASTLVAALLYLSFGISLEAWLGLGISVVIIKSGIEILQGAVSQILGKRVDPELASAIRAAACSAEGVRGAYDLLLNDYGPQRLSGSIHVEVDESITASEIDEITREVQFAVLRDTNVVLHTVGIYSVNTHVDSQAAAIRAAIEEIVAREEHLLGAHGLYVDEAHMTANFDLVIDFAEHDPRGLRNRVLAEMRERFDGYTFFAVIDSDMAD